MRISDWSSDVCSSDLRVLGAVDLERVALGILKRDILEREIVAGDEQPLGARSLLRERQHGLVHPRALRSEEHTSELQSLMRISYAVFCLKKKKNETITSTSII